MDNAIKTKSNCRSCLSGLCWNIFYDANKVEQLIKKAITHVLSGLQGTNYPVSYNEQKIIQEEYLKLLGKDETKKIRTRDYCGPNSYTLQMKHVQPLSENNNTPNKIYK